MFQDVSDADQKEQIKRRISHPRNGSLTVITTVACSTYGYPDWTDDYDLGCLDSYNASIPFYTDTSLTNPYDRTWSWILCNEPYANPHYLAFPLYQTTNTNKFAVSLSGQLAPQRVPLHSYHASSPPTTGKDSALSTSPNQEPSAARRARPSTRRTRSPMAGTWRATRPA